MPVSPRAPAFARCYWVILLAVALEPGARAQDSGALLQEGLGLLYAEDYRAAVGRFEQSYNWQPSYEAAFRAGYCYFSLRNFPEAQLWLEKALALQPDSEDAVIYLASSLIGQYQTGRAVSTLREFTNRHPDARRAANTLAAIRADLTPRRGAPRSIGEWQVVLGGLLLVSLMAYMASLRAFSPGIREMGRGAGLVALTSLFLLSPFLPLLGAAGFGWAGYKLRSGFQLFRYERRKGVWASRVGARLYQPVSALIQARGDGAEERVGAALRGLQRAGMDTDAVRAVEAQLRLAPTGSGLLEVLMRDLALAPRLIRESVLRTLAAVAVSLGYSPAEQGLLSQWAAVLKLSHRVATFVEGLQEPARAKAGNPDPRPAPPPDPLESHFRTLGLSVSADQSEVKSGYRRQVRKHHPDLVSDEPNAADPGNQFRRIREAYESICRARGWQP